MKSLLRGIKYYPIIMNIYIAVIMICGIYEIKHPALYVFLGQSFYYNAMLWKWSKYLKFCTWHRILIISMTFCLLLETLYVFGVNINYYLYICSIISILALIISTLLYYFDGRYQQKQ